MDILKKDFKLDLGNLGEVEQCLNQFSINYLASLGIKKTNFFVNYLIM